MNPKTSQDLFNKIRSQFSNIQVGDESGVPTADPSSAVFFEFEFKEDSDTYGAVSVSLADGENMKVFYNRDLVDKIDEDSKDEWYAFLKELKDFAVEHQLAFDVRDITKSNLTKQDYKNLADTNTTVNTDEMSEELNRITNLAGVKEADPETGLTGGVAPTTIAKQFPGVDDKSSLVRAVTKMKSGESNYTRDEITAAADAFKEILAKDPKETSRLMTMLKGVAQKANPFNHPDDWVGHGMMKNKDANVKGKGRGTDRKGTVWGTESVDELNKITKLAGVAEGLPVTARLVDRGGAGLHPGDRPSADLPAAPRRRRMVRGDRRHQRFRDIRRFDLRLYRPETAVRSGVSLDCRARRLSVRVAGQLHQDRVGAPPGTRRFRAISFAGAGRATGRRPRPAAARRRDQEHDLPVLRRARFHGDFRDLQDQPAGPD